MSGKRSVPGGVGTISGANREEHHLRGFAVILCGLALALAVGTPSHAQPPKEGTYTGTHTYAGTNLKSLNMGEERSHYTYELLGVIQTDSGDALFHDASLRCLGSGHMIKGVYEDSGFCVFMRPDRDQAFATYRVTG